MLPLVWICFIDVELSSQAPASSGTSEFSLYELQQMNINMTMIFPLFFYSSLTTVVLRRE